MKFIIAYTLLIFGLVGLIGCTDLKEDLTAPPEVNVHKSGVTDSASANFHGNLLINQSFNDCAQCHAADYSGGTAQVSCAAADCHPSLINHFEDGFLDPASQNAHGNLFTTASASFMDCASCHGDDYSGGPAQKSCATQGCHPSLTNHFQNGFLDPTSQNAHGNLFATSSFMDCASCHGDDYLGGPSQKSCATQGCHPSLSAHKTGFLNVSSPNFHGKFIASMNWELQNCTQCHGDDYAGGVSQFSCNTCHSQPAGPEACNTCHGDFSNPALIAPPQDLEGNTSTSASGVGAHQKHLFDIQIAQNVPCSECHTIPSALDSQGHIDATPGTELVFGSFSTSPLSSPTYEFNNFTCANTYCHGNWEFKKADASVSNQFAYTDSVMVGRNYTPVWNLIDGTQADCGTCHGQVDAQNNLVSVAPTGHTSFPINSCSSCHVGIVDDQGNIIDPTKHINGIKNVFGN